MRLRLFIAAFVALSCVVMPASALAQSLSDDVYSSQGGQVLGTSDSGETETAPVATESAPASSTIPVSETSTAPVSESSSGTLPFTGFQAGLLMLVAIGLFGAGALLRRLNGSTGKSL